MSAAISTDDRAVGPPERLHPLFLLSGLTGAVRGVAGAYALIGYLAISGRWTMALIAAVGLLVFGLVGVALYWTRFEFRVGDDEIRIDSGILSRTHRSIPFDRIQDVDISQGPLQRLLGLAKVTFETGGGSAMPGAEEGVLQAVTLERAQQIRTLVRARRTSGARAAPEAAATEGTLVYAMSFPRLLLAGTFNFSLAVLAGLFGLTQTFGDVLGFDPLNRRFWTGVLSVDSPIAGYILQHRVAAATAGALLLALLGLLTGIVRTTLRDYGFRLDGTDVGLRRRRGLLTRTDVTLPVKRAQAVVMGTGPVRDLFGWRVLKLQSLARDEGGGGDHVLAPLADDAEVNGILSQLGWRPLEGAVGWQRISPAYVSSFALAISPLFLATIFQAAFVWPVAVAYGFGLAVLIGLRWLAWRRTAYALDRDRLLIRTGWWRRRLAILPTRKIQSIDLTENFITRRFDTATLHFGVAGGRAGGHSIPAIPRGAARQLRDELLGLGA